ncbi:MAG: HAMP domain-containing histidine kinase [Lachnospiraceae bacterium]|nr:HAMP domain-containing histidine kinase [Lachnospiraceae bacterium]
MGWLKRKWRVLRESLFHLSLKKALALYIVLGTAITLFVIGISGSLSQDILNNLHWKYQSLAEQNAKEERSLRPGISGIGDGEPMYPEPENGTTDDESEYYGDAEFFYGQEYYLIPYEGYVNIDAEMDSMDRAIRNLMDFLQTWGPFLYIAAGVSGICISFYRNKLKVPLQILADGAEKIAANDLEFTCEYQARDEMGRLCAGFEKMRGSLRENHQKMWDMMEEQRRLNHAFAHDLRTPLTVLHGYIDFLEKYYPEGKISREKLMETLVMMDRQVLRLRRFGDTMKSVSSLEDRKAVKKLVTGAEIFGAVKSMSEALDGTGDIRIWTEQRILPEQKFHLDEELFLEVAENLLSNGMRYAKEWLQVILVEAGGFLELYVKDDGPGFSDEGLRMATKPYYRDKGETDKEHFGIGLYICRMLCEKHGGGLSVHNSVDGGAIVSAAFETKVPEK